MLIHTNESAQHQAWNRGKLMGQKPPLQPKHVWAIRMSIGVQI